MEQIYSYKGMVPVVPLSSFVHETAVIIGDVILSENCYIGPCAVLRGDFGRIKIGDGSNIQETCVIHSFPNQEAVLEEHSHIGHGAVLHGCHIGKNVLVGMNAVIMDKAYVGNNCIVGALSLIKAGDSFEDNFMIVGSPAKALRKLTEDEIDWKCRGTNVYQALTHGISQDVQKSKPLRAVEPNRKYLKIPHYELKIFSK